MKNNDSKLNGFEVSNVLKDALTKIAPLWSLENFVAVNPYLGMSDFTFDDAAQYYQRLNGCQMTMPTSFYLNEIKKNRIKEEDVKKALDRSKLKSMSANEFIKQIRKNEQDQNTTPPKIQLGCDYAQKMSGIDWSSFMIDHTTSWASSYFDKGIATWNVTEKLTCNYSSWKREALVDQKPRIHGLKLFYSIISELPNDALESIEACLNLLSIKEDILDIYLHALLLRVGGWSSYNAGLDWDANLYGGKKNNLLEFLAILLAWELVFKESFKGNGFEDKWKKVQNQNTQLLLNKEEHQHIKQRVILQNAFDNACQRELINKFSGQTKKSSNKSSQKKVQAIFCIDVRSEVYRRNFEIQSPEIETMGFAGFFAFPINYIPIGNNIGQHQCPALIPTGATIKEIIPEQNEHEKVLNKRKKQFHLYNAWKSFRHGAVSCFSYVSPIGLTFLPKLFLDGFGVTRPFPHPKKAFLTKKNSKNKTVGLAYEKESQSGLTPDQQVELAKNALQAMSLTKDFAQLILIVGHGSTSVNNPHATGYDCGACGGNSGEANAKVAAEVLNKKDVRNALKNEGIKIPDDTHFVAAEHDTTTDEVKIFKEEAVPKNLEEDFRQLKKWLVAAGQTTRFERALRLNVNKNSIDRGIIARSKDWSQVRHEWGLAGCNAFVIAQRRRTKEINLQGKSFLHSYNWEEDQEFKVLELIMTAPMVVTSWINMQYYASTVDNKHFGSGNKTLHNITGGFGVLEGSGGDLRVGLPWQALHDGEELQHLPNRLNVVIEAPLEAVNNILKKHQNIRNLCDNKWIFLMVMNQDGRVSHIYNQNLAWENICSKHRVLEEIMA